MQIIFSFTTTEGATGEGQPAFEGSAADAVYQLHPSPQHRRTAGNGMQGTSSPPTDTTTQKILVQLTFYG